MSVLLNTTDAGAPTPSYASQTTFATGSRPASVSIGDLNGDGKPDLAIANSESASVSVLLNTTAPGAATPTYANQTTFATGSGPKSVSIGDFNGDGKPDLAIANSQSNSVSVLLSTTAPGATTPSYASQTMFATENDPLSVSIGDFNGDGKPDLAIANFGSNTVSVLLNATTHGNPTVSSLNGTTFAAPVGGTTPLGSLAIANGPTSLGGSVTTTGAAGQVYRGPVQLGVDVTINSGDAATAGPVTFSSTVDSLSAETPFNLIVKASGRTLFGGTVGGINPLNNLWTEPGYNRTDPGNTRFEATTTPSVTTNGIQVYADNVILAKATQLVSNGNGISFLQKVVSASGLASTLEIVTAGTTTFSDSVGGALNGTLALGGLTTGAGATVIHGATVYTSGAAGQVYRGPVQLGVDLTINSGDAATAGPVTFSSTVDTLAAVTPVNLAVKASGPTRFSGAVGKVGPFASLSTAVDTRQPAGTTFIDGGFVATVGDAGQSYIDKVVLGADTSFTSGPRGAIVFSDSLDGAAKATFTAGGALIFFQKVGGATPLRGISIKSASSVFAAQSVVLNGADNAAADDGLVIGAGVNAVTIAAAGSSFNGFRGNGIVFSGGSTNSLLSGFDVKNNGASAIAIGAGSYSGTVLQGMTISGNKNGLWLDAAKGITIKTNHVISNTAFGLYAKGLSTGTTVTGNTLSGNGTNIDTTAATGGTFQTS